LASLLDMAAGDAQEKNVGTPARRSAPILC